MAGPPPLYYLAIDGTEAQDSAVFGALLEGRGWKNLASTFLKPAPDDPSRLVDPAHDFLSIPLIQTNSDPIAVVSPNGANGTGLDVFWKSYAGTAKTKDGQVVEGRYAAAELSAALMQELILTPQIHTNQLEGAVLSRHFPDSRYPYTSKHAPAARILFVSSHGWQSGRMKGDVLKPDPSQPGPTAMMYGPETPYFLLGAQAEQGGGFHGPEWIIFAQCSTLNSASWPFWAKILGRSSPGVRGILAYEEASPKPVPAVQAIERFFKHLDQGATFLDAWRLANRYTMWAALVHREARKDTLRDFPRFRPLSDVSTTATKTHYDGYLSSLGPAGEPVNDRPHAFTFKLEHELGQPPAFDRVVPERIDTKTARFMGHHRYRFTVFKPPAFVLREVRITVVHIRFSLRDRQLPWDNLFSSYAGVAGTRVDGFSTTTLTLRPSETDAASVAFDVVSHSPGRTGLDPEHAFLWFRVVVQTDGYTLQEDFKEVGLYR